MTRTLIPTLTSERLVLRPFREQDLDAFAQYCADEEVMRYLGGTLTREDAWRQIAMLLGHWQLRGYGMWALEERATGAFVGRCGFHRPEGWPGLEIGWMLGRASWGRGCAQEAARAALAYGFGTLGLEYVISLIHPDNARSIRLAERLGEHYAGRTRVRGHEVLVYRLERGRIAG
jgi:RimJ/RimL family protein N-acetyltransferase